MSSENIVNIFERALEPTNFRNLTGTSGEILQYLNEHTVDHSHAAFLEAIVNPLLAKCMFLDPAIMHTNIEFKDNVIPYSVCTKVDNCITTLTLDVYGAVDEAYPTYKNDYGPIVNEHVEDILRAVGCMETLVRFCIEMVNMYRHTLNHSFFVNYEPGSYQLIIPVNKTMTIDITISSKEVVDEEPVQSTDS